MPKILKLFIYGGKDNVFDKGNSDEKAIYYLYKQDAKLNEEYANELSRKYT